LTADAAEEEEQKVLAKAQELEKQLRAGADFAKAAREQSQDPDSAAKGGDIGNISADSTYPHVLVNAAVSLKPGEISKPIRTEFGYHLVKLNAYAPAVQKSFEEMKPALVKQLRQRKFQEKYFETTETFRNTVYEQGASLAPVAEALGLKIQTSDWFDRNGGSGIAAHPRVVEAAFSNDVLTQSRNSDAFDIPGDTLVSVRLAGHRPSTVKPLAEVRPQIERVLRQEAAQKAARERGEVLVKEAVSGQPIEALARKNGHRYFSAKTIARNQTGGFDPAVVEAAFRAERPKDGKAVFGGVDLGNKGYAVFMLARVQDGDPAKADGSTKSRVAQMLEVQRGQNYYMNYHAGLKQKSDIKVYQNRF
jgi:peptidyl-prolyl cis-trans isomerase D